jgi:hypothetical protein
MIFLANILKKKSSGNPAIKRDCMIQFMACRLTVLDICEVIQV